MNVPSRKTFVVYDYNDLRGYLIDSGQLSYEDADTFWGWWCGGDGAPDHRTGPAYNALRYVPLGYWGWTDDGRPGCKQKPPPENEDEDEHAAHQAVHRALLAFEQFANKESGDLRVFMTW